MRFFIGIILGLVAEFVFMGRSTRLVMSLFAARWMGRMQIGGLKIPAWMFDRTACSDAELLTAQTFVSIDALTALGALLDLALMDQTPSAALLSGASRASHDQNRDNSCHA